MLSWAAQNLHTLPALASAASKPFPMLFQAVRMYSDSAQIGPMRTSPPLAWNAIACSPGEATVTAAGAWGQYAFHAVGSLLDLLIDDGARAVDGMYMRDFLIASILVGHAARVHAKCAAHAQSQSQQPWTERPSVLPSTPC